MTFPTIQTHRRTLLLTSVAPTTAKTGGIVLYHLAKMMPANALVCAVVPDRVKYSRINPDLTGIPTKYFLRLNEYPRSFIPPSLSKLIDRLYLHFLTQRLVRFAKVHQVEAVWCVLESLTQIFLAKSVANELGVPLLTQVWDPPSWWLRVRRVRSDYANYVLQNFDEDISRSKACAVTSWAMADTYQKKYGVPTAVLLPSLPKEQAVQPATNLHSPDSLTIALAGQVYADDAWECLIRALDSVQWKISNRSVTIHLFGRHDKVKPLNHPNIVKAGWTSQSQTIQRLLEMDILYCPYWFNPAYTEETTMSFPSKLITYFAAGRPVFYHGPKTAGPAVFLDQHHAGYVCSSQDAQGIIEGLRALVENSEKYKNFAQAGHRAFIEFFTLESAAKSFQDFLNA